MDSRREDFRLNADEILLGVYRKVTGFIFVRLVLSYFKKQPLDQTGFQKHYKRLDYWTDIEINKNTGSS